LRVQECRAGQSKVLAETALPGTPALYLRMQAQGGNQYRFAWSTDGRTWTAMQPPGETADGRFLPPWDRGVRVGVVAQGPASATAAFERFELRNQ